MKNKFIKGALVLAIACATFVIAGFGQRYVLAALSSLLTGGKVHFVSVGSYVPIYVLGAILFSLGMGWLAAAYISGKASENHRMLFGLKIKRNLLLAFSLLLLFIGSSSFYAFSGDKIYATRLLKGEFLKSISYASLSGVDMFPRFYLGQRFSRHGSVGNFYCTLAVPAIFNSDNGPLEVMIPLGDIERLATLIKNNKVPYRVRVTNECGDYPIPQDLGLRIEKIL